ncbi:MAG TPA: AAA family ATPase [Roseiflexaceae bacterium]|nr:AAA family ATPase [Roseiflexaceae bacterium]
MRRDQPADDPPIHLRSAALSLPDPAQDGFPFSVPAIRSLAGGRLEFGAPVTVFVGENGSGKSTLLEALACAARAVSVGSESVERDATLAPARALAARLKLTWRRRTHRGFFLRSEDFFGYAKRMHALRAEAEQALEAIERDPDLSDLARQQARIPHARTLAELRQRYGEGLDTFSHGESYLTLFRSRLVPDGLYLLDEPEAPLSPMRQLGLLSLIKALVEERRAQFVIATHSPILMACPGAAIYSFDGGQIAPVAYEQIEHVNLMRDFLASPQRFLRHL